MTEKLSVYVKMEYDIIEKARKTNASDKARKISKGAAGMILMGVEVTLLIFDAYSLKEKRSVVKSILRRTENRHHLSAAEVDDMDLHNKAVLGFAIVGNDRLLCRKRLEAALREIEADHEVEILDFDWIEA